MPLCPDKPNPRIKSFANPQSGFRRCTKCLVRKSDDEFRWLWTGIRKASQCKGCEKIHKRAKRKTDGKIIEARHRFQSDPAVDEILKRLSEENPD
jgi:hypothetical protein